MRKSNYLSIIIILLLFTSIVFSQKGISEAELGIHSGHILKVNTKGELECLDFLDKETSLLKSASDMNYTLVRSLNDTNLVRDGLKIILRATDQLLENEEAILAFRRAAAIWERFINDDITIIIDVDFGPNRFGTSYPSNVLGSTLSSRWWPLFNGQDGVYYTVDNTVEVLKAQAPENAELQGLYDAIPIPTPTTRTTSGFDRLFSTRTNLQALGIFDAHDDPDEHEFAGGTVPNIGFNSAFNWDFNPSDGISPGFQDFDAVVIHEIGHVLGFSAIAFFTTASTNDSFMTWDFFRMRPEAVANGTMVEFANAERVATPGPVDSEPWPGEDGFFIGTHLYFDGINKWECSTALSNGTEGDGRQASHWRDDALRPTSLGEERHIGIMDPTLPSGLHEEIGFSDLRMLQVIGYDIDFEPEFSEIAISVDGNSINVDATQDTILFGDIDIDATKSIPISISNTSIDSDLQYQVEFETRILFPDDLTFEILFDKVSSTIAPGQSEDLLMTVGNSPIAGLYFGSVRLHTNAETSLVIEILFEFNVGGAIAPTVSLSTTDLGEILVDNKEADPNVTRRFDLSNKGNIPLEYSVSTSLAVPSVNPPGLLKSSSSKSSVLKTFFNEKILARVETLYEEDFESDFGGFVPEGDYTEDWNRTDVGKAALTGHSATMAVYYGSLDSMLTKDEGDAWLIGPSMDLSNIPPADMVVFAYNYYLDAEVTFDFASVHVSVDNGETFEEVATSNAGIMENTTEWTSVMIQLPLLSGTPEPVVFAFRFTSDTNTNGEGWYIDDVSVSTIEGANSIYTTPRAGVLENQDDSQEIVLFLNTSDLSPGWAEGMVTLNTNDVKSEVVNIPFLLSKTIVESVEHNKMYASTGRGSGSKGRILEIDVETGAAVEIGESGFEPVSSLTINWDTEELYGINNSTGQPTTGIRVSATAGGGLHHFETETKLQAMVFDDEDNTLYGVGSNETLYTVDPETGALTQIGDLGLKINAITLDPLGDHLFGAVGETSQKDRIYKIDKETADTIRIGRTGLNKKMEALAFDSEGNLYATYGSEQKISTLIKINAVTGAGEEVGSTGFRGVLGLAYAHDPLTGTVDKQNSILPESYDISQNYPNPFNPVTTIKYSIPFESSVKIRVYNSLGQLISTLINQNMSAGFHNVTWDGANLASGIYFYNIEAIAVDGTKDFYTTKKMVLLK